MYVLPEKDGLAWHQLTQETLKVKDAQDFPVTKWKQDSWRWARDLQW